MQYQDIILQRYAKYNKMIKKLLLDVFEEWKIFDSIR